MMSSFFWSIGVNLGEHFMNQGQNGTNHGLYSDNLKVSRQLQNVKTVGDRGGAVSYISESGFLLRSPALGGPEQNN